MVPPNPPFPDTCSLRFHPDCGNQTSTRMSESLEGVSRNITRQNAGTVLNAALAFALVAPAGTNAPAGMVSEDSTRPPGRLVCDSASHASGAGGAEFPAESDAEPSRTNNAAIVMRGSVDPKAGRGEGDRAVKALAHRSDRFNT